MNEEYYESMTENLDGLYGALLESGATSLIVISNINQTIYNYERYCISRW